MLALNYGLYIRTIYQKIQAKINHHLYTQISVVGKKSLNNDTRVHIIQLDDYTRVWLFQEEIQIINDLKISSKRYEL